MLRRCFAPVPAETSSPSQALHSERRQGTGSSQLCWLQGCLEHWNPETTIRSTLQWNSLKEDGRGRYVEAKRFLHLSVRLHFQTDWSTILGRWGFLAFVWQPSPGHRSQPWSATSAASAASGGQNSNVDCQRLSTVTEQFSIWVLCVCVHDRSTRPSTKHGLLHHATHSCLGQQREEINFQKLT